MSTSPTFKYRGPDKWCPFPFNRDEAIFSGVGGDNSIALTETDGDEGLAEACRLWWLLESVTFYPTGTATRSFPNQTTSFGDGVNDSQSVFPFPDEPRDRVAKVPVAFYPPGAIPGSGYFLTIIYFDSRWRLSCNFRFDTYVLGYFEDGTENEELALELSILTTDTLTGVPVVGSGTFSLFGYTIPWAAFYSTAYGDAPTVTGLGLTATSTFYTLV